MQFFYVYNAFSRYFDFLVSIFSQTCTNTLTFVHTYITAAIQTYEIFKLRTTFRTPKDQTLRMKIKREKYSIPYDNTILPVLKFHYAHDLSVRREILAMTP